MACPELGICIPVSLIRVIDGDTVVVASNLSGREIRVRLRGVDAAELNEAGGEQAKQWLEEYLRDPVRCDDLRIHFAFPEDRDGNGKVDLDEIIAEWVSFERVTPCLWAGGFSVEQALEAVGYGL